MRVSAEHGQTEALFHSRQVSIFCHTSHFACLSRGYRHTYTAVCFEIAGVLLASKNGKESLFFEQHSPVYYCAQLYIKHPGLFLPQIQYTNKKIKTTGILFNLGSCSVAHRTTKRVHPCSTKRRRGCAVQSAETI